MKVINLTKQNTTYTSNAYFIRGDWNTLEDKNALIDTGRDPVLFHELDNLYTGVGKTKIERVLLTHGHYDHTGNLKEILTRWNPEVFAYSESLQVPAIKINDGDNIRIGDRIARVIACPGHSSDSVCFYVSEERALFSGDTQLTNLKDVKYDESFYTCLEKISQLDVQIIYPGHGRPITQECNLKIRESLKNISQNGLSEIRLTRADVHKSHYDWIDIESEFVRIGKIRCELGRNIVKIFSITVYPEFERRGFARRTIEHFKMKYNIIVADRVRPSAQEFWEKMEFSEDLHGNYVWEKI
ncbi:MAG: MBL fold metallo-hydrolase [Candidatus Marinimicrobia bacterium]|nr:MBL fold metallo-hydrolase [Candidatus Neomarinimicrobiota bacterium]